jgi:iron complex transport system permease protein
MALLWMIVILCMVIPFLSLGSGAVEVSADRMTQLLSDRLAQTLGLDYRSELDYSQREVARDQTLILEIRLPRILLGMLVGVGLALAGATLQSIFRTPLADPGLIGVTSGAALGAAQAIVSGWSLGALVGAGHGERAAQALSAFGFGLLATALVYRLAVRGQRTDSSALLLIGLAVNGIAGAYVGLLTFTADEGAAGDITFWTLGDFSGVFWSDVRVMLPFLALALLTLPFLARQLNLLALGETEARHLGVNVGRLRVLGLAISALMVGVGVAIVGMVSFVGLVVPNLMRALFGPDQRILLPSSALGGALFVVLADWLARTIAIPSEIPLGVITTLCGGPIFLTLIWLYRRELF